MKIQLVSHASVIFSYSDATIWTDPWLFSKAFNDSWALLPEAQFEPSQYDQIDYLWISHEHPDHFHIPPGGMNQLRYKLERMLPAK